MPRGLGLLWTISFSAPGERGAEGEPFSTVVPTQQTEGHTTQEKSYKHSDSGMLSDAIFKAALLPLRTDVTI